MEDPGKTAKGLRQPEEVAAAAGSLLPRVQWLSQTLLEDLREGLQ